MTPLLIRGPVGLGDNIYLRAAVRRVVDQEVYLETVWPQLVADLPIKCVHRTTTLRAQGRNAARSDLVWHEAPAGLRPLGVHYVNRLGSMLAGLLESLRIRTDRVTFDLPTFPALPVRRPYVVIRPATIRKEWPASSRNPRPEYLALAAERLREHFHVVSVADLEPGVEWPVGALPYADEVFHAGELTVEQLLAMVQGAAGCVGGVGWLAPAAVAYRVPLFLIYGGCGQHDGPRRIFDARMPTENVHHAIPDRFCMCSERSHDCDKTIATIDRQVDEWAMGLVARGQAAMAA